RVVSLLSFPCVPPSSLFLRHPRFTPFPYTTLFRSSTEAEASLRTFAVCSDAKVGRGGVRAGEDVSVVDLPIPATTNPARLAEQRSEEHTSELQSRFDLVCRLLLEKNNKDGSI